MKGKDNLLEYVVLFFQIERAAQTGEMVNHLLMVLDILITKMALEMTLEMLTVLEIMKVGLLV